MFARSATVHRTLFQIESRTKAARHSSGVDTQHRLVTDTNARHQNTTRHEVVVLRTGDLLTHLTYLKTRRSYYALLITRIATKNINFKYYLIFNSLLFSFVYFS